MKQKHLLLLFLFAFVGCNKTEGDKNLRNENERLKQELDKANQKLEEAETGNDQAYPITKQLESNANNEQGITSESIKQKEKYVEESEALKLVADYYDFYNAEYAFRNARVRRMAPNKFRISVQECINKEEFKNDDFHWRSVVRNLTVYENGKYEMSPEIIM